MNPASSREIRFFSTEARQVASPTPASLPRLVRCSALLGCRFEPKFQECYFALLDET